MKNTNPAIRLVILLLILDTLGAGSAGIGVLILLGQAHGQTEVRQVQAQTAQEQKLTTLAFQTALDELALECQYSADADMRLGAKVPPDSCPPAVQLP